MSRASDETLSTAAEFRGSNPVTLAHKKAGCIYLPGLMGTHHH